MKEVNDELVMLALNTYHHRSADFQSWPDANWRDMRDALNAVLSELEKRNG